MTNTTRVTAPDAVDNSARVSGLRTQYPVDLLGVPRHGLRLRWKLDESSLLPVVAHQISWSDRGSGPFESAPPTPGDGFDGVMAPGGPPPPGTERWYRVRVATDRGWGPWSEPLLVDVGFDFLDVPVISVASTPAGASPYLRREFLLTELPTRARLRVTALGTHELFVNGERVGDEHLAPGWTAYGERVVVATHDVTDLMIEGANVLGAVLADGWFRGRLGWRDRSKIYGDELGLILQLDLELEDGSVQRVTSDTSWRASTGSVTASSLYDGTTIDFAREPSGWSAAGFDDSEWRTVTEIEIDRSLFVPRIAPPVRSVAEFPMTVVSTSARTVLDAGQNIAGWVRLVVRGNEGDTIVVRHAEVLEADGSLHIAALRSARATDTYVLDRTGEHVLEPRFTYHGFRFADVEGTITIVRADAIAISSDTPLRSDFECSHPGLNALHESVRWSQRGNFVSLPTDCPQRDERLGWTGDVQAFGATAVTLLDTETFLMSWLTDLAVEQHADGAVPAVVPNILIDSDFLVDGEPTSIAGRAGWADAATIVPWAVYESYGSTEVLERQLDSMRQWVAHLTRRAGTSTVLPPSFQLGDWLDPDAPGDRPWEAKVPADFVANAFFARSAQLLARTERLVGDPARARDAEAVARAVARETWSRWGEQARYSATGLALAIEFSIAPHDMHAELGDELAALVRATEGRITTGFLGTPLVLPALSRTGHLDEAYRMLLRREAPSWLYQIDQGATTLWERWDAISPDGAINRGDLDTGDTMISFNHYAYGAVIDWVYRNVAGIAPLAEHPGYRRVIFAPRPAEGLYWARASVESRFGTASIDWRTDADGFVATVVIPNGSTGILDAPVTARSTILVDSRPFENLGDLGPGRHEVRVTDPAVARYQEHPRDPSRHRRAGDRKQ